VPRHPTGMGVVPRVKRVSPSISPVDVAKAEILVPASAGPTTQVREPAEALGRSPQFGPSGRLSIEVDPLQDRTAAKHGITGQEIERLNGAAHFMEQHCPRRGRLFWLSLHKGTDRETIAHVQKRITKLQKAANLPCYSAWVFESRGGLHAHILFIGDRSAEIERRLCSSKSFGTLIDVRLVYDLQGLIRKYLAKERTPQAGYQRQHVLGGRIKGSHRLEGGGDRVRLSRELERDAIEAGYVEPWRHTNARRSAVRKPYSSRRRLSVLPVPTAQTTASSPVSVVSDGDEHDDREHEDGHIGAADASGLTAGGVRGLADAVRIACRAHAHPRPNWREARPISRRPSTLSTPPVRSWRALTANCSPNSARWAMAAPAQ
jgi:hypothetical protein